MADHATTPPSAETIAWVEQHARAMVVQVAPLFGATTAAVHRVTLDRGLDLVLKRFTWPAFLDESPDRARHEALMLDHAYWADVPVPRLVAYDESAEETDVPAVLMTHVDGEHGVDLAPEVLAEVAAAIADVPATKEPWIYHPYFTEDVPVVPSWSEHPAAWEKLTDTASSVEFSSDTFVHRDFHPWNVLHVDGTVTAVVDWLSAGMGPWEIDISHCRTNYVLLDRADSADRYLREYERLTGRSYDPIWDAMGCVDALPHHDGRDAVDAWNGHSVVQAYLPGVTVQRDLFDALAKKTAARLR